jgi:hypothetical protein
MPDMADARPVSPRSDGIKSGRRRCVDHNGIRPGENDLPNLRNLLADIVPGVENLEVFQERLHLRLFHISIGRLQHFRAPIVPEIRIAEDDLIGRLFCRKFSQRCLRRLRRESLGKTGRVRQSAVRSRGGVAEKGQHAEIDGRQGDG